MDYEKKYNEALNQAKFYHGNCPSEPERKKLERMFPELKESKDERIRKEIVHHISLLEFYRFMAASKEECLAYLEKQKEQEPDIELIQRSWYLEGYHDREFGKEPKWIIKIGEGGPKYEENPKYGQMLKEQKPDIFGDTLSDSIPDDWRTKISTNDSSNAPELKAENMDDVEACMLRYLQSASNRKDDDDIMEDTRKYKQELFELMQKPAAREKDFVSKPKNSVEILKHYLTWATSEEENCPYSWKELADAIRDGIKALEEQQPAEWSEEDKNRHYYLCNLLRETWDKVDKGSCIDDAITWFEELPERIVPHSWKPSEEQMDCLQGAIEEAESEGLHGLQQGLIDLMESLKKL